MPKGAPATHTQIVAAHTQRYGANIDQQEKDTIHDTQGTGRYGSNGTNDARTLLEIHATHLHYGRTNELSSAGRPKAVSQLQVMAHLIVVLQPVESNKLIPGYNRSAHL